MTVAVAESATLQGMLKLCTDSLVRNLNAAFARVWTVEPRRNQLVLRASSGMYTHLDGPHARVTIGKSMIGTIASERKPHISNDVANDARTEDRQWARCEGLTSFAGFPLLVDNRLLGVLAMFSRRELNPQVTDSLAMAAQTIAIGIERKRLEDQLRHTQKMEALGQLAGGIAHDFNNLLTIVTGGSSYLLDGGSLGPDEAHWVQEISDAADRAGTLTKQLLAFGRQQVLDAKVQDLDALLAEIERLLRRVIGEDIQLVIQREFSPAHVFADRSQLEQVLMNLAVNARDAMPDGGRLTIELKLVELDASVWQSDTEIKPGYYIMLSVSDTGVGMSRDVSSRIFEPYFTTKDIGKGTGLGLATVYGVVKQSDGHIHVYSEVGIGTTFKVYLPWISADQHAAVKAGPLAASPRSGNETILLVEDDAHVRTMCARIISSWGYTVVEARNGEEALQIASAYPGELHLVVTDMIMPGMGGRELAEKLTNLRPQIRALFMSGYSGDVVLRQGILADHVVFLQKPFTPGALADKVRHALER